MKKTKKGKIVKIVFVIVLIIIGILVGHSFYNKYQRYKFEKMLKKSDATNYELVEKINDEETSVKVRDKVLVSESGDTITWVSGINNKRVLLNINYKTAIITENDEELEVNSLNYSYINDYFNNKNQKFKYLGKEDGFYKIQFTNQKPKM